MASAANLLQPAMEEKSLDNLALRELADLLRSKLAAEEKVAKSAAVMVPEAPIPLVSLLLADLLRTKLADIEKKIEYAAVLVQPIVVVPEALTLSPLLLCAVG
jgi:hypothetical protein